MEQYEYLVKLTGSLPEYNSFFLESELNKLGDKGWKLINIDYNSKTYIFIRKKRVIKL